MPRPFQPKRGRDKMGSVGVGADFLVPAFEQLFALGRIAIGLEVVIDQLDVFEARRFLRDLAVLLDGSWKDFASFM